MKRAVEAGAAEAGVLGTGGTCLHNIAKPRLRPRLLALHGARSNSSVTQLQLENLRITDANYEIFHVNGPIEVPDGDPDLGELAHGPFFSWLAANDGQSVIEAVRVVLAVVEEHGPFDMIYGFSSGGVIAALVANIAADHTLRAAVLERSAELIQTLSSSSIRSKRYRYF
jgi:hypothetical protein